MSEIFCQSEDKRSAKLTLVASLQLVLVIGVLFFFSTSSVLAQNESSPSAVKSDNALSSIPYPVHLYVFYRTDCSHCREILPLIESLPSQYPTLVVHTYEIGQNAENYTLFQSFLKAYNLQLETVPSIFIGKQAFQGTKDQIWEQIQNKVSASVQSGAFGLGDEITGNVEQVYKLTTSDQATDSSNSTTSPNSLGEAIVKSSDSLPLPLFVTTALISGFNPCVFSVLIFLMSTLTRASTRNRMLSLGVTYIATVFIIFFFSALAIVQFVRIIGAQNLMLTKIGIGVVLLIIGIVSVKDFFWYNRWFSFKIPSFTKHRLSSFAKTGSFVGVILLGFVATVAAIPCTLGPFTYFSTTYLNVLPPIQNNAYTALFSFFFIIPMVLVFLAIVGIKVGTDRAEKWRIKSARYMKLISGLLMVAFGLLLMLRVF
jgi:cytochrome c biogenesis protein CcdA/thiol-disulfide isomerase/thioredoxin